MFRVVPLVVVALLTACSPGAAPVSESLRDPSNPAAAEGAPAPGSSTTRATATGSASTPAMPTASSADPAGHSGHTGHVGH